MTEFELMKSRHSVRRFVDKALEPDIVNALLTEICSINNESGLHFQLFINEPGAFQANRAHYGEFKNCRNYFALVGRKNRDVAVGYYGQRLVLKAQELGLNTCWVALTYRKSRVSINADKEEKFYVVIALGYGEDNGLPHRSKNPEEVSNIKADSPEWFKRGVEAALLAPTAINQQKFCITNENGRVILRDKPSVYSKLDLGIVKYQFELGAGKENFEWV